MKGLLRKNCYMIFSYFRSYLLLVTVFIIVSWYGKEDNVFWIGYPCILSSVVATSLINYDEREKWDVYAMTLPFSRAQLVSAQYMTCLLVSMATVAVITLSQGMRLAATGRAAWDALQRIPLLIPMCLVPTAVMLPFMYRFGSEKGRLAYYVALGVAVFILLDGVPIAIDMAAPQTTAWTACLISLGLFGVSWLLSIRLYQKRDIG